MNSTYTAEQIRAMDGAELCIVAFQLGLAPKGVVWDKAWLPHVPRPAYQDRYGTILSTSGQWKPDETISHADALFRTLRTRHTGWLFSNTWVPSARPLGRHGYVEIMTPTQHYGEHYGESHAEEAHALTLCAVLAVVREQEQEAGLHAGA